MRGACLLSLGTAALLGACGEQFTTGPAGSANDVAEGGTSSSGSGVGAGDTPTGATASATTTSGTDTGGGAGGANGGCGDLKTDPSNCGACGHDCLGAPCQGGVCKPDAVVKNQGEVVEIAVDDARLYWVSKSLGVVGSVAKGGGAPQVLATGQAGPHRLTLGDQRLFWSNHDPGGYGAWWVAFDGSASGQLSGDMVPYGLARDGGVVFWVLQSNPQAALLQANVDGSSVKIVAAQPQGADLVAVDELYLYLTCPDTGAVVAMPRAGGPLVQLASAVEPAGLAIDESWVYYTDAAAGEVRRVSKSGDQNELLADTQAAPMRVVVDAGAVTWSARGTDCASHDGSVVRWQKADGSTLTLAQGQACPEGVAVDGDHAYWASPGAGGVFRVPR